MPEMCALNRPTPASDLLSRATLLGMSSSSLLSLLFNRHSASSSSSSNNNNKVNNYMNKRNNVNNYKNKQALVAHTIWRPLRRRLAVRLRPPAWRASAGAARGCLPPRAASGAENVARMFYKHCDKRQFVCVCFSLAPPCRVRRRCL